MSCETPDAFEAARVLDVLAAIHPPLEGGETIEVRYLSPERGVTPIRRFYTSVVPLLQDAARYRAGWHCYFGVVLRRGRDGTASGVSRARACWADIDAKLWSGESDPKAAAQAAIEAVRPPPSVVIDSGGGYQPYWLLEDAIDLRELQTRSRLERVNAALARAVCGLGRKPDAVHDVARVLRFPGSLNHKPEYGAPRPVRVVWLFANRRYTLTALEQITADRYPWIVDKAPAHRTPDPLHRIQALPISIDLVDRSRIGRIRRETLALLEITGPAGYPSASEADAAIAAALVGAGLTAGEAFSVILDSPRGQDATRRKGERHATSYWQRTVQRAAAYVGPVSNRADGLRVRYSPVRASTRIRTISPAEIPSWP